MIVDVWLYGSLAKFQPAHEVLGHAHLQVEMPDNATMSKLLERLALPLAQKGITFVNGELTDMPGLAADLQRELHDGDRVGLFDTRSAWPFQYRFGAAVSPALEEALQRRGGPARHATE